MKQQRYINVSFSILIILMCFLALQIFPEAVIGNINGAEINLLIPAIFLILGATVDYDKRYKDKESAYIKYCAKQYLLYYVIFVLLGLCIRQIGIWMNLGNVNQEWMKEALFGALSFNGFYMLWLFPVLFVVTVIYGLLRKSFPLVACVGISIALSALSFFAKGIWDIANGEEIGAKLFFLMISMVLWRGCNLIGFVALGDVLNQLLIKLERKKLLVGIVGILFCVTGFFLVRYSEEAILAPERLEYGKLYVTLPAMLLIACGILMLAKWIGEFGVAEVLGRNWKVFFVTFSNLLFLDAVNIVGSDIFQASKNNFLTAISKIILLFILEVAVMLVWELQVIKLFSKKEKVEEVDVEEQVIGNNIE